MTLLDRRLFLKLSGIAGLAGTQPRLAFAAAPTENRLVFVILRGGLDGLHAVPPYADPMYHRLRPNLAVPRPGQAGGALDLDGGFGLHPGLAPLHDLYRRGELLVVPAATTRYRDRSHFDGQNMLEGGAGMPFGARDGWLNRAIASLDQDERRLGLALGPAVPLLLQGDAPVRTWAESPLPKTDADFLDRLAFTYRNDPLFMRTLADAQESREGMPEMAGGGGRRAPRGREFEAAAQVAAQLLAQPTGPRIAVMESRGWDTHFGQQWRLAGLLDQLAAGILALRDGLGAHWRDTAVMVVSEFGRTAAENGSRGTDHGVGGIALLVGGAVNGGRVTGRWPGLGANAQHEGRDVVPTTDYESLFKATLIDRLGIAPGLVEDRVFPDSRTSAPTQGLFRSA